VAEAIFKVSAIRAKGLIQFGRRDREAASQGPNVGLALPISGNSSKAGNLHP
jgi:hypothetical protein